MKRRRRSAVAAPLLLVALSLPAGLLPAAESTRGRIAAAIAELTSDDVVARESAVQELIRCGPEALPALDALVATDPEPLVDLAARRAYGAIVGLTPEWRAQIESRLEGLRTAEHPDPEDTALWLLDLGESAVTYALETRSPAAGAVADLRLRLRTLAAVADLAAGRNQKDAAACRLADIGAEVLEELTAVAGSAGVPERWRAVAAERLVGLCGVAAVDAAIDLSRTASPVVREITLPFLCQEAAPERFADVVGAVSDRIAVEPRLASLLERYSDRLCDEKLREHLSADSAAVRSIAARVAGSRRDAEARPELKRLLSDDEPEVAAQALRSLGMIGEREDLDNLVAHLDHELPRLRRASVEAVAALGGEQALAWVAAALADPDASVRVRAATCLAYSEKAEAVDSLIAALGDPDPSVLAAATRGLARLTSESIDTIATVSSREHRQATREAWENWWQERNDKERKNAKDGNETAADLAVPLAGEGGRILANVVSLLQREFRPYGKLKEQDVTATGKLVAAAVAGMVAVVGRKPDPDDPELLTLELDEHGKKVLRHLLEHGRFERASDLGRMVGSLPIGMSKRDYILLTFEAAHAIVGALGDRFTRLSILEDAAGEIDKDKLPGLFGKAKSMGLMLEDGEGGARVEFVMALSPAHRAGLRTGDKVLSVNGELTAGMERSNLARKLRQPADLLVLRDGWTNPVAFHIEPESDQPDRLVTSTILPGRIGYLRLRSFEPACAQKVEWALRALEKEGIDGLILDLRNNPGGTVVDAAAIVDKFVPTGKVITTNWTNSSDEDQDHEESKVESTDSDTDRTYPLAVLINKCSASASEMTSGALSDLERCVVVGRTSWGKGIGQNAGGSVRGFTRDSLFGESRTNLSLSITVLEYFLPSGRSIQGIGVEPDVTVDETMLLGERFELLRRVASSPLTREFVDRLIERDPDAARALARFDGWDPSAYDGFDDLEERLDVELATDLVRAGVRRALRERLAADDAELAVVDVQEDEDVRAAIAALAPELDMDLAELPEYEDLAE